MTAISFTGTGPVPLPTNLGDMEAAVSIYSSVGSVQFAIQWSPDGTNGWQNVMVRDIGTGSLLAGTLAPVDGSADGWIVPVNHGYLRANVIAGTSGVFTVASKALPNPAPFFLSQLVPPAGLTKANTNITAAGAGTLTAAAAVGGLITRSGPAGAYSDTWATAAQIIAALTTVTVGQSWTVTIKNTVNFAETLLTAAGITLSGQVVVPPNCTGDFLVTVASSTTLTIQGLRIDENAPLPNAQFSSINATTGSIAAGVLTGARVCNVLSTNAVPGAQLVRTAAQMLADIPNGVVGLTWTVVVTNSGTGTLTLTTDAGATVTMTGTMTVPTNTWRMFQVTINTATTATVQSIGAGTI